MSDANLLFAKEDEITDENEAEKAQEVQASKYLIFLSDGVLFGVHSDYVAEIITHTAITHLPMVPSHISGVINLRGQIVPIVDIRLLLGKMPGENYCTIVLDIEDTQIGILVDSVDQMVDIPKESILLTPAQNTQKLVSGMCSLPGGGGTMMVLDCAVLLHD